MEKFKKMLAELQGLNLIQEEGDWEECLPEEIWEKYFNRVENEEVCSGLNVDKHRWYEISTTVISIYGGLLGIRLATDLSGEDMDWEDCYVSIEFLEMEEIQITSYKQV